MALTTFKKKKEKEKKGFAITFDPLEQLEPQNISSAPSQSWDSWVTTEIQNENEIHFELVEEMHSS